APPPPLYPRRPPPRAVSPLRRNSSRRGAATRNESSTSTAYPRCHEDSVRRFPHPRREQGSQARRPARHLARPPQDVRRCTPAAGRKTPASPQGAAYHRDAAPHVIGWPDQSAVTTRPSEHVDLTNVALQPFRRQFGKQALNFQAYWRGHG